MILEEMFKETIFVEQFIKKYGFEKGFNKQLTQVSSELFEVQEAFSLKNYQHTKEEVVDVLHSAAQLSYMIPNYKNGEADKIIEQVRLKNLYRKYYI